MDQMQEDEKRLKVESAQRPKTKFETFAGKATKWDVFMRDPDKIFSLYEKTNQKIIQARRWPTSKPNLVCHA